MKSTAVAPTRTHAALVHPRHPRASVFDLLHREVDQLFDSFSRGLPVFTSASPSINVAETDREIEITAELPGLEDKDVQVSMAGDVLTIRGEKTSEREEGDKSYRLVERSFGSFSRSVELPPGTDPSTVQAVMAKGVLTVTVPKPAAQNVKTIEIKSAA